VENGFHYVALTGAEFSSHKVDMGNAINMRVGSYWKIYTLFGCKTGRNLSAVFQSKIAPS
jgi:hypothetical protein